MNNQILKPPAQGCLLVGGEPLDLSALEGFMGDSLGKADRNDDYVGAFEELYYGRVVPAALIVHDDARSAGADRELTSAAALINKLKQRELLPEIVLVVHHPGGERGTRRGEEQIIQAIRPDIEVFDSTEGLFPYFFAAIRLAHPEETRDLKRADILKHLLIPLDSEGNLTPEDARGVADAPQKFQEFLREQGRDSWRFGDETRDWIIERMSASLRKEPAETASSRSPESRQ